MRFTDRKQARINSEILEAGFQHPTPLSESCDLVQTAKLLEPAPLLGETQRAAMRSRMMRAADRAQNEGRDDAGSHDGQFSNPEVHSATVMLDGGYAVLADVNDIDPARAAKIVADVIAKQSPDRL